MLMEIREILEKILSNYKEVYEKVWKEERFKNPLFDYMRNDCRKYFQNFIENKNLTYDVHVSTGKGRTTKTPWFAFLDSRVSKKVSEGIYVAYLFNKDARVAYLTLMQSTTQAENKSNGKKSEVNEILYHGKKLALERISNYSLSNLTYPDTGNSGYDAAIILYKRYKLIDMPTEEVLERDFIDFMRIYNEYCSNVSSIEGKVSTKVSNMSEVVKHTYTYLTTLGYTYDRNIIKDLFLSLKTKPFVILAGISGTGKSKLAMMFSQAIGAEFKLIPVRPDWSDSTDLFGYVDLQGIYQPGYLTQFIKDANEHLNKPYILCLDEMNLARVEHYFSDVLSVIETRDFKDGIISSSRFLDDSVFGANKEAKEQYGSLYFSENLYIIGTVNMDETTFPFSKKVLDRANTIELSDVDLRMGLEKNAKDDIAPISFSNKLLMSEYDGIQTCYQENKEVVNRVISILTNVNEFLKLNNSQFAYRVRDEICYFISYALKYELLDFDEAMDFCLMQKILPRIQGSGEDVVEILIGLLNLCLINEKDYISSKSASRLEEAKIILEESIKLEGEKSANQEQTSDSKLLYPMSAKKIGFMLKKCEGDFNYASYWI